MLIRNCRTTAGGSILIELDDAKAALDVLKDWKETFFEGNKGIIRANELALGIIKFVDDCHSQEFIKKSMEKQYRGARTDLFYHGADKLFTGTVKINFVNKKV